MSHRFRALNPVEMGVEETLSTFFNFGAIFRHVRVGWSLFTLFWNNHYGVSGQMHSDTLISDMTSKI